MKAPFQPEGSSQLIMLMGCSFMENPIAVNLVACLTIQDDTDFCHSTWAQLVAATDGPAISTMDVLCGGHEHTGGLCPLLPIPAWLTVILMDANTDDTATLCTIATQAICNSDTQALDSFLGCHGG